MDTAGIRTVYGMDTEGNGADTEPIRSQYGADTERYGENAKNC